MTKILSCLNRRENMPGLRNVNDVFLEDSKESLNESYDFKLENSLKYRENESKYQDNNVSNFQKLNLEPSKHKRFQKDNKLSNFTASYLNVETLYDASSFKSAISYDLVESLPAFNNFEKDTGGLFSKPTKEDELKLNNYSISSTTKSKEAHEKVVCFFLIFSPLKPRHSQFISCNR